MEIPMTSGIDVPEPNVIFSSELIDIDITKPIPLYGYVGNHAEKNTTKEQLGTIVFFKKGLVFLQAEGVQEALQNKDELHELIKNSWSFAIPYVQIVKAEHKKSGFLFNSRLYLVLTQQINDNEKKTYYFSPASIPFHLGKQTAIQIMYHRKECEQELLMTKEVKKYMDTNEIKNKIISDYENKYGVDFDREKYETKIIDELREKSEDILKKNNLTLSELSEGVDSELDHFYEDKQFVAFCLQIMKKYVYLTEVKWY